MLLLQNQFHTQNTWIKYVRVKNSKEEEKKWGSWLGLARNVHQDVMCTWIKSRVKLPTTCNQSSLGTFFPFFIRWDKIAGKWIEMKNFKYLILIFIHNHISYSLQHLIFFLFSSSSHHLFIISITLFFLFLSL